ncbi:ferredoxin [bacterium]|nr:ferredoxin [bacterium]
MKVKVDRELCIGCGLCEESCPEVFALDDEGKAYVLPDADLEACDLEEVANSCPAEAITVED